MNSAIKTTDAHTLNLAPLSQLPSFTSLGSIGHPHLSNNIIQVVQKVQILPVSSKSCGREKAA